MTHVAPHATTVTIHGRTLALLPNELPVMLRGELPPDFVLRFQQFGVRIPKRGTVPYTLRQPGAEPATLYCRRAA